MEIQKQKTLKQGFTLLELLVVVLIIGILAAIALPQYKYAVLKTKFHTIMDLVNSISAAQQRYFLTHGVYSDNFANLDIDMPEPKNDSSSNTYKYDKDKMTCKFACGTGTSKWGCGGCNITVSGTMLEYWFEPWESKRYCVVYASDETANKICKDITGKDAPTFPGNVNFYRF